MQLLECNSANPHSCMIEGHRGSLPRCGWPVCDGIFLVGEKGEYLPKEYEIYLTPIELGTLHPDTLVLTGESSGTGFASIPLAATPLLQECCQVWIEVSHVLLLIYHHAKDLCISRSRVYPLGFCREVTRKILKSGTHMEGCMTYTT